MEKSIAVVGIDIGTVFSSCGVSLLHDPTRVCYLRSPHFDERHLSSVLFKPDRSFHSFGIDAETAYDWLEMDNEHSEYYFFSGIKNKLFDRMTDSGEYVLESEDGKLMPAIKVFSTVIHWFMERMMKMLDQTCIRLRDITWVITAPPTWNEKATSLLRSSAVEAGIQENLVLIPIETEAAALGMKYLNPTFESCSTSVFKAGMHILICNAGGGTTYATVFEFLKDGVNEKLVSTGGEWGGALVYSEYLKLLEELFGSDTIAEFQENISAFREHRRYFEGKTKNIKSKTDFLNLSLPGICVCGSKEAEIPKKYENKIQIHRDIIKIHVSLMKQMFRYSAFKICTFLEQTLRHPNAKAVEAILFIGGMAQSDLIKNAIDEKFSNYKVVFPSLPLLFITCGAAIYGHGISLIKERVANFTYGCVPVYENENESNLNFGIDQIPISSAPFDRLVEVNTPIVIGKAQIERYYPKPAGSKAVTFFFYASTKQNPLKVSDESCFFLGSITLQLEYDRMEGRVLLQMRFAGSTLDVIVRNEATGEEAKACVIASRVTQKDDYLLVGAIDFGTTYSGYAFSSKDDFQHDPTEIRTKTWPESSGKLQSLKTPTCALFKPSKEFDSFGFKAEDRYIELVLEKKHEGWFFFRRFKMKLHKEKTFNKEYCIASETGDLLPAVHVFSSVIRFLRTEMLKDVYYTNLNIHDFAVLFVITVPAIWTDSSKSFMRQCAVEVFFSSSEPKAQRSNAMTWRAVCVNFWKNAGQLASKTTRHLFRTTRPPIQDNSPPLRQLAPS